MAFGGVRYPEPGACCAETTAVSAPTRPNARKRTRMMSPPGESGIVPFLPRSWRERCDPFARGGSRLAAGQS